jgi:hypothetical protein
MKSAKTDLAENAGKATSLTFVPKKNKISW